MPEGVPVMIILPAGKVVPWDMYAMILLSAFYSLFTSLKPITSL
jgi:hypothetical protein